MLHILLLILKFIGIIIAAILGILVLLICMILFAPVRYDVRARCGGTFDSLKGKAVVTWFFHLLRADIYYKQGRLRWRVRFAFYRRSSGGSLEEGNSGEKIKNADTKREEGDQDEKEQKSGDEELEKNAEELSEAASAEAVEEGPEEIKGTGGSESRPKEDQSMEGIESSPEESEEVEEIDEEACEEAYQADEGSEEGKERTGKERTGILQKVKDIREKIKCTFEGFCDKIKLLAQKKDKLAGFVHDEVHRKAFFRTKKELFRFLGKLKPERVEAKLRYGFENPYHTGKVLAGLAVMYPFLGDHTEIVPDFENKVLEGSLSVKGRIRLSHLAYLAWKLFWDRNIRQSYKDIRNFEL